MELEIPAGPFEDVKKVIEATYRDLWAKTLGGHPGLTPATLEIHQEVVEAGYRPIHNALVIGVSPDDLMDPGIDKPVCDPQWLSDLVHEMVHEYQAKVVKGAATSEGQRLRVQYGALYPQPGHGEDFFTGVPLFADTVGMPIKGFVEWIARFPFL